MSLNLLDHVTIWKDKSQVKVDFTVSVFVVKVSTVLSRSVQVYSGYIILRRYRVNINTKLGKY